MPESERYQDAGRLGIGGVGEVRAAIDMRLDREVALKLAQDPRAEAAMVREAQLTARLDHPGIVAIHGAGRLPNGRAYYSMPVLRGRTVADALAETPELAARLRLVRHLLDACNALAHAHEQGVLHRDIKPSNLLIGAHGETQVADWGLATRLEADGLSLAEPALGTPRYCSPEQEAGRRLDPRSDLYSLGVTLLELLGEDGAAASPELVAIAARATRPQPQDRYPRAAALAEDLLAWFEGRRVQAYDYSPAELTRRAIRAWRTPLIIAGVAALIVMVSLAFSARRVLRERDLARTAEQEAQRARADSEASLAAALVAQARVAAAQDRGADAEILAAHALALAESPVARGVLARFFGQPRPQLVSRVAMPDCYGVAVSIDGGHVACHTEREIIELGPDATLRRLPIRATSLVFAGEDTLVLSDPAGALLVVDPGSAVARVVSAPPQGAALFGTAIDGRVLVVSRGRESVVDLQTGATTVGPSCSVGQGPMATWLSEDGSLTLACSGGSNTPRRVVRGHPGQEATLLLTLTQTDGPPSAMSVDEAGGMLAVGTETGAVVLLDTRSGAQRRLEVGGAHVADLALLGGRLAVAGARGGVSVWDTATGHRVAELPSQATRIRWRDAHLLRVVGDAVEDWNIPDLTDPARFEIGPGVSAVAVSPDGALVASTHGDGQLWVHELGSGALRYRRLVHDSMPKDVAFSPAGDRLAAGAASDVGARVFDAQTGDPVAVLPATHVRRLAWASDALYVATYGTELHRFGDQDTVIDPGGRIGDLEAQAGGPGVILLVEDGRILRVNGDGALSQVAVEPTAQAVAASADRAYAILPSAILMWGAPGSEGSAPLLVEMAGAGAAELALSEDMRWLAVGQLDGQIGVYDAATLQLRAVLTGHSQRVSALAFDRGRRLVSGSWDGSLRVWALDALDLDTTELAGQLERAWGRHMNELLSE